MAIPCQADLRTICSLFIMKLSALMGGELHPKSRFKKRNPFADMSLRAPERCVAISPKKPRLLLFTRRDNFLNRDLGAYDPLTFESILFTFGLNMRTWRTIPGPKSSILSY